MKLAKIVLIIISETFARGRINQKRCSNVYLTLPFSVFTANKGTFSEQILPL